MSRRHRNRKISHGENDITQVTEKQHAGQEQPETGEQPESEAESGSEAEEQPVSESQHEPEAAEQSEPEAQSGSDADEQQENGDEGQQGAEDAGQPDNEGQDENGGHDDYESERDNRPYEDEVGDGYGSEPADDGGEDDELTEQEIRRRERRRRRRREQTMVTVTVTLLVALFTALVIAGVLKITKAVRQHNVQVSEEQKIESESEAQESDVVLEAPSSTESTAVESTDYLGSIVDSCIQEMPVEDKVAQLFIVTPEQLTGASAVTQAGDATQAALSKYSVGGIVYFRQNLKDKDQITEMLKATASMSKYPLFFAVDEEGGSVSRVAEAGIDGSVKVDTEAAIAKGNDPAKAEEAGETIGSYLGALGFNLDFAPVADVVTDASKSVIGDRSYGSDPANDGKMTAAMVQGLQKSGVSACLKHFPGIGDADGDTHKQKVELSKTLDQMKQSDFISFKAGIDSGAQFVMVSHGDVSAIDDSAEYLPASMSKKMITDELRGELGFNGIVVTDAMNMSAVSDYFGADEAAVKAIQAGADMILIPEDLDKAYNGVLAAVKDGKISEDRINQSLERIYRVKYADKINQKPAS